MTGRKIEIRSVKYDTFIGEGVAARESIDWGTVAKTPEVS